MEQAFLLLWPFSLGFFLCCLDDFTKWALSKIKKKRFPILVSNDRVTIVLCSLTAALGAPSHFMHYVDCRYAAVMAMSPFHSVQIVQYLFWNLNKSIFSIPKSCSWHQKNETTNSPIHQFKVLHKEKNLCLMVYYFLFITWKNILSLAFSF